MAKQSALEAKAIETRRETLVRNDYDRSEEYSILHSDALSNGDPLGKGTGMGGHTHSTPDFSKPSSISYSNFDTFNGGGLYDIEGRNGIGGRNFLTTINKYNSANEYGPNSVDMAENLADGQISF